MSTDVPHARSVFHVPHVGLLLCYTSIYFSHISRACIFLIFASGLLLVSTVSVCLVFYLTVSIRVVHHVVSLIL